MRLSPTHGREDGRKKRKCHYSQESTGQLLLKWEVADIRKLVARSRRYPEITATVYRVFVPVKATRRPSFLIGYTQQLKFNITSEILNVS